MRRRGFTIVELVIVIVIMAILMTLGVVNLRSTEVNARDTERKTDIESIAQHLETYYTSGTDTSNPSLCTGGTVTHVGLKTIHTFTVSGTLTCNINTGDTIAILVVAGGGGGGVSNAGDNRGGGGGGGDIVYYPVDTLKTVDTSVVVGGGGAYSTAGSNSSFGPTNEHISTTTAYGGGAGGNSASVGGNGGNGGGGGAQAGAGNYSGGTGSPGNNGGQGGTDSLTYRAGGGGGGAGVAGVNANVGGSSGGVGLSSSISGTKTYYGGGGGGGGGELGSSSGGVGGLGGGGDGGGGSLGSGTPGYDGIAYSGGGGGGSGPGMTTAGSGGSGIVIVSYLTPVTTNTYPSTALTTSQATITTKLRDIDINSLMAPGITDPTQTFISATCSGLCVQTTAGVIPQPTINQYVYQPIQTNGLLCDGNLECSKFNLYYRIESTNAVDMVSSVDQ